MQHLTQKEATRRMKAVRAAKGSARTSFSDLVKIAGLNPARDLRFANLSGVDFTGQNLDGYDFTGCKLVGCTFSEARVSKAVFSQIEVGRVGSAEGWEFLVASGLVNAPDEEFMSRRPLDSSLAASDGHLSAGTIFLDDLFLPEMVVVDFGDHRLGVSRRLLSSTDLAQCPKVGQQFTGGPLGFGGTLPPPLHYWSPETESYRQWVNEMLGFQASRCYRLLTEKEWEFCCRPSLGSDHGEAENSFGVFAETGTWELCSDLFNSSRSRSAHVARTGRFERKAVQQGEDEIGIRLARELVMPSRLAARP